MQPAAPIAAPPARPAIFGWLAGWWRILHFAALTLVMALSPSSHTAAEQRRTTALHVYLTAWKVLPWFSLLSALFSLVLIRIVVVTAQSYGLSRYALEMVVRVLVVEILPLAAALFVALRSGIAVNARIAAMPRRDPQSVHGTDLDALRRELLPRVIGSGFAVIALVAVSGALALFLAYFVVYGLSPWGLASYTRSVGQIFDPVVGLGFALKTLLFSLAVATVPVAAGIDAAQRGEHASAAVLGGTLRLLVILILIEAGSLAVKFI